MEGFPTLVKELWFKPNILRLWPVHPARKWPCSKSNSLSPHSLQLDLRTAFLSCHTSWIIWQKGWRWDRSPQTVQRGQGTWHQLCHPPFSQGQHRHHMVWLSPSRGPRICIRAKPSVEICTPRNHLVDLWHSLWKVKTWKPWKLEKSRSGWRDSIIQLTPTFADARKYPA